MSLFIRILFASVLVLLSSWSNAQEYSNIRIVHSRLILDSVIVDSVPIVSGSMFVFDFTGNLIPDSLYNVNYIQSKIYPSPKIQNIFSEFRICYRTLPSTMFKPVFHKDLKLLNPDNSVLFPEYGNNRFYSSEMQPDFFSDTQLKKHGTIARGINMGNNQDVVMNSTLNLQLSGRISDDLEILAAISDENIPIQPEGNSQNLQEFDKVYIQLFNENFKLTAGDIELKKPHGYFMNIHKKAKGGLVEKSWQNENKKNKISSVASISVMKGKYHKMSFNGKEGNQGPYRLRGAENETYIVVISGSERVYVDGVLLTRGAENHYIIDYNTAEIRFMPAMLITADKRISVEFEYADRYYNRFLLFGSSRFQLAENSFFVHVYSEKDAQNQPIDQELTNDQKKVLSEIGDSLNLAIVPSIYMDTAFSGNYVFYALIDSIIGNGERFEKILRYSTNSGEARYRATFSYVGINKGNYILDENALANGRVYKWLAPVNSIPQGDYEPVKLLVSPKKKQLISSGGLIRFGNQTELMVETALSINDLNTYSSKNSADDIGFAIKTEFSKQFEGKKSFKYKTSIGYTLTDKNFSPPEQFREIEFNRSWNLGNNKQAADQHLIQAKWSFSNSDILNGFLQSEYLRDSKEEAFKNTFSGSAKNNKTQASTQISFLKNAKQEWNTSFLRDKFFVSRKLGFFSLGAGHEMEDNRWVKNNTDSLLAGSFKFQEWNIRANTLDTSNYSTELNYYNRFDWKPNAGNFKKYSRSQTVSLNSKLSVLKSQTIQNLIAYRELNQFDTSGGLQDENTLIGRMEHIYQHKKNWLNISTIYELGTSLEPRKEFSYLEVTPGQGQYIWNDYNKNNIKELNEFELAVFTDTAKYIRIQLPVESQIKTYSVQLTEIVNIRPYSVWYNEKGWKKLVSLFSDQFSFRIDRKITNQKLIDISNPFLQVPDSQLMSINSGLRNIFSYNKISPVFSVDYTLQTNQNKTLLFNGFETRYFQNHGLKARYNFNSLLSFFPQVETGIKSTKSDVYENKNYEIENFLAKLSTQLLFSGSWKLILDAQWQKKTNLTGPQLAIEKNLGTELRYSYAAKGNISAQANYIFLDYNDKESSSVAYEMLMGLKSGKNITIRLIGMYNLTDILQLNLDYNFRLSHNSKAIHTGSVQLRAYF